MLEILIHNKQPLQVETRNGITLLNGEEVSFDMIRVADQSWHMLYEGKSYTVELLKQEPETKTLTVRLNGQKVQLQLRDRYDQLLKQLGMDMGASRKINEVKAPMPGLVLRLLIEEGQEIKKGDPLLVLEAMKMENVIKAVGDGKISQIICKQGAAVEKGQVLISLA